MTNVAVRLWSGREQIRTSAAAVEFNRVSASIVSGLRWDYVAAAKQMMQ
jgi:hypothetical protein